MLTLRPARLAVAAATVTIAAGCICDDKLDQLVMSPDGRYSASLVLRNCGATSSYVTLLRLVDRQAWLLSKRQFAVAADVGAFRLRWSDESTLVVEYPEAAPPARGRLLTVGESWRDVRVEVRPAPAAPWEDVLRRTPAYSETAPENNQMQGRRLKIGDEVAERGLGPR